MTTSRVLEMMNVQTRLPPEQRKLFDALYVDGLNEDTASARLAIPKGELQSQRRSMLKSLRAAVA
jgi:DNA-directed RNA polymerase specialized sigma24 family protein